MTRSTLINEIQRYARIYAHHAEKENGGVEFVTDLWGQRLRIMDVVQKAFKPEEADTDNAASKVLMLWCGESFNTGAAFAAWKKWLKVEKRQRHWWYRWTVGSWLGRQVVDLGELLAERRYGSKGRLPSK